MKSVVKPMDSVKNGKKNTFSQGNLLMKPIHSKCLPRYIIVVITFVLMPLIFFGRHLFGCSLFGSLGVGHIAFLCPLPPQQ